MGGLLLVSSFFSGAETALFSLSSDEARGLSSRKRVCRLLHTLENHPDELLTSILLGNLLVNILFFCSGAALTGQWSAQFGGWFDAVGALLILLSVILFGEIVPKAVGVAHPQGIVKVSAAPLYAWYWLTSPFRRLIGYILRIFRLQAKRIAEEEKGLTPAELRELLDAVQEEPGFGAQEKDILEDILILPDLRAREIMEPRTRLPRKTRTSSPKEMLEDARRYNSRYVFVFGNKEDDLLGCIPTAALLLNQDKESAHDLINPVPFIPETRRVDLLLKDFLAKNWNVVAVVDEYGGFSGVVTLEDIFSEIVGDFPEDGLSEMEQLDKGTYRLSGQISVRSWRELFMGMMPEPEAGNLAFDTLGGLIISSIGRVPSAGDQVVIRNLCLTVEEVRRARVVRVRVELKEQGGAQ